MARAIVLLALLVPLTLALKAPTKWHQLADGYDFPRYVSEFSKAYSTNEYELRKSIFDANLATILSHNANPFSTWKMGVSHLTDRTDEEFRRLLGYKWQPHTTKYQSAYVAKASDVPPPVFVDWRQKGIISDVKDQGDCGSCWTFGTAETVESYYALATGQLHVLSEQQILDCTPNPNDCGGTGGCGGGITDIAYAMIIQQGGLASEWTYPYTSYFGSAFSCHFQANTTKPIAAVKSYVKLPSNQYAPVIAALSTVGPLAINVDASAWHLYESGVFTGCNTTDSDIDHVVQLVGYGTDTKYGDYWLIRNSWTPAWGEDGYIRIARTSSAQCTPDTIPGDGTGCNGGPTQVTVCGACGILYDTSYPVIA